MYIGNGATVSSYGAAGALIALLLWVYYSAQIFLLSAEFTKAYANSRERDSADFRAKIKRDNIPAGTVRK